jgi:hypothetical protein
MDCHGNVCGFTECRCQTHQTGKSLDDVGRQIVEASKSLTMEQRKRFDFINLLMTLDIPVGELGRNI